MVRAAFVDVCSRLRSVWFGDTDFSVVCVFAGCVSFRRLPSVCCRRAFVFAGLRQLLFLFVPRLDGFRPVTFYSGCDSKTRKGMLLCVLKTRKGQVTSL